MPEGLHIPIQESHLNEGVKPIMVCIGTYDDFKKSGTSEQNLDNNFGLVNAQEIKWGRSYLPKTEQNFLHDEGVAYVISDINGFNKISKVLVPCTSLIVSGIDKNTNKNISFLSHQLPFPPSGALPMEEEFMSGIKKRIDEMKSRCLPNSVDAVILGGQYLSNTTYGNYYLHTIQFLGGEIKSAFGFEPTVINGPKIIDNPKDIEADDIYYDNENRRAYFIRPKINIDTKDFIPSQIKEEEKRWRKNI